VANNIELGLKLKIAQSGIENIKALIADLKQAGIATDALEADAAQLTGELNAVASATDKSATASENAAKSYTKASQGARAISEQLSQVKNTLLAFIGVQSAASTAGGLAMGAIRGRFFGRRWMR
jgi:hypothetical protein